MAEFMEIIRTAKRMCKSMDDCDVICPIHDMFSDCSWLHTAPAYINENDLAKCEAAIMKWGAENPETRYPTWREWQQENFPEANGAMCPCAFMRMVDAHCVDYNGRNSCMDCARQQIPADIAEKLGIKPKEADHEKC